MMAMMTLVDSDSDGKMRKKLNYIESNWIGNATNYNLNDYFLFQFSQRSSTRRIFRKKMALKFFNKRRVYACWVEISLMRCLIIHDECKSRLVSFLCLYWIKFVNEIFRLFLHIFVAMFPWARYHFFVCSNSRKLFAEQNPIKSFLSHFKPIKYFAVPHLERYVNILRVRV